MLSFSPRKVIFAFYLWSFGSFFSCFSCFSRFVSILRFFFLLLFFLFFFLNLLSPSIREASLNFLLLSRVPIISLPRIHSRPLFTRSFNTSLSRAYGHERIFFLPPRIYFRESFVYDFPPFFFSFLFLILSHGPSRGPPTTTCTSSRSSHHFLFHNSSRNESPPSSSLRGFDLSLILSSLPTFSFLPPHFRLLSTKLRSPPLPLSRESTFAIPWSPLSRQPGAVIYRTSVGTSN